MSLLSLQSTKYTDISREGIITERQDSLETHTQATRNSRYLHTDQPTGTTACPDDISLDGDIVKYCSLAGRGTPCCEDACGLASEWNSAVTEVNYVAILHHMMASAIPGFDPKCEFGVGNERDSSGE